MKKLIAIVCLLVFMASSSMALLSMGVVGAYYSYAGSSSMGYGLELGLGLIPFVDTRLVAIYVPVDSTQSLIPTTLNAKLGLPGLPIYIDLGAGYVIYSNSAAGVTAPNGSVTYSAAIGYDHKFTPVSSLFIQAGYEGMDVKYTLAGTEYTQQYSGVGAKTGVRLSL